MRRFSQAPGVGRRSGRGSSSRNRSGGAGRVNRGFGPLAGIGPRRRRPANALVEFSLYAGSLDPSAGTTLWEGSAGDRGSPVRVDRFDGHADRLFRKFRLFDGATGQALGPQRFVDDLDRLESRPHPLVWPQSIKGVSCPVDVADLAALGIRHTHLNVDAARLIAVADAQRDDAFSVVVDGRRVHVNPDYVRATDDSVRRLTDAGVNVIGVLLNSVEPASPLTHPGCAPGAAPNGLGAFNLSDERGLLHFRAAVAFLAGRYGRPDKAHGAFGGWIIGNEVNDHGTWHHMGPATLHQVARQYADELRVAWYAVRSTGSKVPVFASFDHYWASAMDADARKSLPARDLIDALNGLTQREGDFGWNVAHHPYPESLFEPRFWLDRSAAYGYDTPRVTFKNVEVIAGYLGRPEMLTGGKRRRLILSEQGFHAGATPESEQVQAAAFALAYHRLSRIPAIEAFILHRHADHPAEGGLRLGLWASDALGKPVRKRKIWDVVRAAGTDDWERAVAFALPVAGMSAWPDTRLGPFPDTGAYTDVR